MPTPSWSTQKREVRTLRIWLQNNLRFLLAVFILLLFGSCSRQAEEERFHCSICDGLPYHAPCVVNLSTGRILELSVYDNDPARQGELAETQTTGHFGFIGGDGMIAMKDAGCSCSINIPSDSVEINPALFCNACLEALNQVPNNGVVLADLYDPQAPQYYVIEVGAEYSLRCYEIHITQRDEGGVQVTVNGTQ